MMVVKRLLPALLCLAAALPAWAEDARPRLVAGGMSLTEPELRTELFAKGGFSAGAAAGAENPAGERGRMALGGYAAYAFNDFKLSSSLKGGADANSAEFSAAYAGLGGGVAALRLGYDWGRSPAFSINPAQAGLSVYSGALNPGRAYGDASVSLSYTQDITPSLSWGGFAAAGRKDDAISTENSVRIGAGLGLKF